MADNESEPRLCPIIEGALCAAYGGTCADPEGTRRMVLYVERIKTNQWKCVLILLWEAHVTPEELGTALVNIFTGAPMPQAWRDAPRHLTQPIEEECKHGK